MRGIHTTTTSTEIGKVTPEPKARAPEQAPKLRERLTFPDQGISRALPPPPPGISSALVDLTSLRFGGITKLEPDSVIIDRQAAAPSYLKLENEELKVVTGVPADLFKRDSLEESELKKLLNTKLSRNERSKLQDVYIHLANSIGEKKFTTEQLSILKSKMKNAYDSQDAGRVIANTIRMMFSSEYRQHRAKIDKAFKRFNEAVQSKLVAMEHQKQFETGISKAFGSGVKVPPGLAEAFGQLSLKNPQLAIKMIEALNNPTEENFSNLINWRNDLNEANLPPETENLLKPLLSNLQDQWVANTQFANRDTNYRFLPEEVRETSGKNSFQEFYLNLDKADPTRKASIDDLVAKAHDQGFQLELTAPKGPNPILLIARGHDMIATPHGFKSLVAMHQGDRWAYRVNELSIPGADKMSLPEKQKIMELLKIIETMSPKEAEREFNEKFAAIPGSTYLTAERKEEIKRELHKFADAREASIKEIFKDVTGHEELGGMEA